MSNGKARLGVLSFGLAFGLTWGLGMFILGVTAWKANWGGKMLEVFASVYSGFAPTLQGSLWGGLWGFADGLIGGIVFAFLYNMFLCCCKAACPVSKSPSE